MVFNALMSSPIPIIGAKHVILRIMTVLICTVMISFVERVISEAVENCSVSAAENAVTCLKSAERMSREDFAAMRDANKADVIAQTMLPAATVIIIRPVLLIM